MNTTVQLSPTNFAPASASQPNEANQPTPQSGTNSPFAQLLQQEQKSEYKEPEKTELAAPSTEATTANITPTQNSQPNAMAKQAKREQAKLPKGVPKAEASSNASQTVNTASPLESKAKNDAADHERERFAASSVLSPDPLNPTPTTAHTAINLGAKQPICAQGQSHEKGEAGSNFMASTQALVSQKSPSDRSHPASLLSGKETVGNTLLTAIGNDSKSQIPKAADNRGEANNLPLASYLTPNSIGAQADVFKQFGLLTGLSKKKEDERTDPVSNTVANSGGISITAPASNQGLEAPRVVTIATPAQAPEFKEALALQVSLLAKDGVNEATLQLNPENMGPISVQISTDGTQARVEFAVESSATRDIIEAGMPDLASALRDAGLTFSGGSVSQNNSQRGDSPPPQPGRSRSSPNEGVEAPPLPQPNLRVRLGGLDLYA